MKNEVIESDTTSEHTTGEQVSWVNERGYKTKSLTHPHVQNNINWNLSHRPSRSNPDKHLKKQKINKNKTLDLKIGKLNARTAVKFFYSSQQ